MAGLLAIKHRRSPSRPTMIAVTCLLISACGGGGGSEGGGPVVPPPPPPPVGGPVIVTAANAQVVATVGASLTESAAQVALAAVSSIVELYDTDDVQLSRACLSAGMVGVVLGDNDGDGVVSSGDDATITYSNDCFAAELNAPVSGSIAVQLTDVSFGPGRDYYLAGSLSISPALSISISATETASVSGSMTFVAITRGVLLELLKVNVGPQDSIEIEIEADGTRFDERIESLSLSRSAVIGVSQDGPYTVSISGQFDSDIARGELRCSTVANLAGNNANFAPLSGEFDCTGAAGSTARLDSNRGDRFAPIALRVDPEGDGTFASVNLQNGPATWEHFVDGGLFATRLKRTAPRPFVPPPAVTPTTRTIDIKDIAYSAQHGELVATTATGILRIDPATMDVLQTVDVANNPGALALSEDGSVLWVAFDDSSELQRFTYPQLAAGPASPLGDHLDSGGVPRIASSMSVAPGSTDIVVVSTDNIIELVAYDDGVQLANVIGNAWPSQFIFRDGSSILAVDGETTGGDAYRISLDPATGLTLLETFPGMIFQAKDRPGVGTDHVYVSGKQVINENSAAIEAFIEPQGALLPFFDSITVDPDSSDIYAISNSEDRIDLFSENNFVLLGRYDIPSGNVFGAMHATLTPDHLVIVRQGVAESYLRDDIQPNITPTPCYTIDLSGALISGTYIILSCEFSDAVYDPARERIYAGLGSFSMRGNSVAIIDATTLEIDNYIPVGGKPVDLHISADGSSLYAGLANTSKVIRIDLDARMVADTTLLGFGASAYIASAVAPTAQTGGEFLAVVGRDVALYGAGTPIGTIANGFRLFQQLFVSDDGSTAIAKEFDDIGVFSVSASGVSSISTITNVIDRDPAEQRGNVIFAADGVAYDIVSGVASQACVLPPEMLFTATTAAGPDHQSSLVYYSSMDSQNINAETINYLACNPNTQTTGPMQSPIAFQSDDGEVIKTLPVSDGRIAIVTETQVILLDRPDL